ncbi:PREDICTED: L-seryl-tRNA(Sec) kinase-like [Branchiostoma belcheri]|uniref:L-seryl-tRNA(Sec) kinase-like n=1 Tax=Branchiostoma belcheri TaxID=7741 RepID=A0A6P4YDZ1_BRABE|nr:PREDICTED: L-seryl-tRNA(Sec) kinase-like [Branchiostoma belcheri]
MASRLCLLVLSGLPGSGKTSLARKLQESWQSEVAVVHVCYDELIPEDLKLERPEEDEGEDRNGDQQAVSLWKQHRRAIHHNVEKLLRKSKSLPEEENSTDVLPDLDAKFLKCAKFAERNGRGGGDNNADLERQSSLVVIIDDNMYYRSMRYHYYQLARKYTIGFCEVFLHCDVETALKRNMERQSPVARETVVAMATKIEPPNPNRHSWEVMSFNYEQATTTDEETALEEIRELVAVAIANPVLAIPEENMEEKEQSRLICSMNVLHQADQILRKCISDVMGSAKADNRMGKAELKILGRQLNKIRAELLDDLKHQKLQLPPIESVGPQPGAEQEGDMSSCSSLTDLDSPTEVEVIEVKTLEGYILRLFRERRAANPGTKST